MVVGLTVGGWFASVVISRLINGMIDYAKERTGMWGELKGELARLEKALPKIQAVVDAVDQGLIREANPALEKWLWQLRDAADMADDVMDEFEYNNAKVKADAEETKNIGLQFRKNSSGFKTLLEDYVKGTIGVGKNQVKTACLSCFLIKDPFNKDPILKRLKDAVKAIDEVAADVEVFYMVVQNMERKKDKMVKYIASNRETSSVLNVNTRVFGRDNEKEEIIKKLLNPGCQPMGGNFCVLPIIGNGGIGKTTLAQIVYNNQEIDKHFDLRMWVCISNTFDVVLLTKKLYESAFGHKADFENFDSIQRKLYEKLQFKKFLIVFDDAWNDNDKSGWQKLLAPLKSGDKGSMVLLTTRMESVVRTIGMNSMDPIFLKGLKEDEYWDLFVSCAFGNENPIYHKKLQEIGRGIVKRLERSPLAAKTVGGMLYSRLDEEYWRSVLESEIWSLDHGHNDIIPALRLSYEHLDSHLKPCFSFCSLFPQDHGFNKEDLIYMWMAVGLVPRYSNRTKRPEDKGSEYFDELVNKSLLERKYSENYTMHDLLHDLAQFVSQGECFRYTSGLSTCIPTTVRHLHAHVSNPSEFNLSHLKNLHTLILHFDQYHPRLLDTFNEIIEGLKNLRILRISGHGFDEFPECVNDLLHLRYLYLYGHRTRILPKTRVKLYLLQRLGFGGPFGLGYSELIHLSYSVDNITKLINLRKLSFPGKVIITLVGVGRLTSLQNLGTAFHVEKKSGCRISELKNLIELCGNLSIRKLENVESHEEALQANLKNKEKLHNLCLSWESTCPNGKDAKFNEELLDHLEPHYNLKRLQIICHTGGRPPIWMRAFPNFHLEKMHLERCNWGYLPSLEELPYLKYLSLSNMVALKKVHHQAGTFPSLEKLTLENMPVLQVWSNEAELSAWMPYLRQLRVKRCPELRSLPRLPPSLKEMHLDDVGLVALPNIWQDQRGSLPSLADLWISNCSKLTSLSEEIFEHPENFTALEKLAITHCRELMHLPRGGFSKFIALNELSVDSCPKLQEQMVPENFLPSSLQTFFVSSCGSMDAPFLKALEYVNSIISLQIWHSAITSPVLDRVLGSWKNLRYLRLNACIELVSLESLQLLSIDQLVVMKCPKLTVAVPSPPTQFGFEVTEETPSFCIYELHIDDPLLLSVKPLRSLSSVRKLTISDCSKARTLPEKWLSQNSKTLQKINLSELSSLESLPVELTSLSYLKKLDLGGASKVNFLPQLPPSLKELTVTGCSKELASRCKTTGKDWYKLAHVQKVYVSPREKMM